jgi:hypothetical protein
MQTVRIEGEALTFFNNLELNAYDDNIKINLMDLLPMVKKGIIINHSIQMLLGTYLIFNNLADGITANSKITLDEPLKKFINYNGELTLGTFYQLIQPTFCNVVSDGQALLSEYGIIRLLGTFASCARGTDFDLYKILYNMPYIKDSTTLFTFSLHPKINKFYLSILFGGTLVNRDIRGNNFKAYKLAKLRGNNNIIQLVLDDIISRILLYKEILRIYSVDDIYSLMAPIL